MMVVANILLFNGICKCVGIILVIILAKRGIIPANLPVVLGIFRMITALEIGIRRFLAVRGSSLETMDIQFMTG